MKLQRSVFCIIALMGTTGFSIAGETPFAGTWKLNPGRSGPMSPPGAWNIGGFEQNSSGLLVISDADGGLIFDEPGLKWKAAASFNGKPGAIQGPSVPPGAAVMLTRLGSHSFRFTRTQNGRLLDTSTWTVSQDGKTLKSFDTMAGKNTPPSTEVFDKQ